MSSYDELEAEIGTIQWQIVEAKKSKRLNSLRKVKDRFQNIGYITSMLKRILAEGRKR